MGRKWKIGDIVFSTKEDYRAGQRDLKRIKKLTAGILLEDAAEARELYRVLSAQPFLFETEVGVAFRSELYERAAGRYQPLQAGREDRISFANFTKSKSNGQYLKKKVKKTSKSADKHKRKKKLLFFMGGLAAGCVMLFALYQIFSYDILSYLSRIKMEELISCVLVPYDAEVSEEHRIADLIASGLYTAEEAARQIQEEQSELQTDDTQILYQYSVLYERNPEMAGWIQIADTIVNYPVMLTAQEEEYYLKRGFDRKYDINGLPFMDARCSITEPVTNYLIYGHNMKNGSMFSTLLKYEEESFYQEHPLIRFDTVYETGIYEIVGVFRTAVAYQHEEVFRYYQFIQAEDEESYDEYINYTKEHSFYETGVTAEYGTQLLTLSTCDRSIEEGRFVIVCRKRMQKE